MDKRIDEWMIKWNEKQVSELMNKWTNWRMLELMNSQIDRWMNEKYEKEKSQTFTQNGELRTTTCIIPIEWAGNEAHTVMVACVHRSSSKVVILHRLTKCAAGSITESKENTSYISGHTHHWFGIIPFTQRSDYSWTTTILSAYWGTFVEVLQFRQNIVGLLVSF